MDMITEFDKNILKKWALNYFPQQQRENSYMSVEDIWYMWENDTADIENARFTNGVSRGVFIFDDSDYVVSSALPNVTFSTTQYSGGIDLAGIKIGNDEYNVASVNE